MNRKNLILALPLIGYFALLADLPYVLQRTVFYAFQTRDLNRAFELLNGNSIFYGPEMTGGGNLPGPLYYFLLVPALIFGNAWEHAWLEMVLLAAFAAVAAWWYLRTNGFRLGALLACTMLALAVYTQHFFSIFINPSYQFFLLIPALILICRAFDPAHSEIMRGRSFVAAALVTGLSLQLHFSMAFLIPAMFTLQVFYKKLAVPQIPSRYVGLAIGALPLASLPYLIWLVLQNGPGQEWNYVGNARDVIPTLLFLFKAIQNIALKDVARILTNHLLSGVNPVLWVLGIGWALSQILKFRFGSDWTSEDLPKKNRGFALAKPLAVCAAFGFIPFSYIAVVPIANRYGLIMLVAITLLVALLQDSMLSSKLRQHCFNAVAALTAVLLLVWLFRSHIEWTQITLIVTAGFIALWLTYFNVKLSPAKAAGFLLSVTVVLLHREVYRAGLFHTEANSQIMIRHEQWQMAWTDIYRQTGWSVDQVKQRVFFVNAHLDGDPEPMYRTVVKALGNVPTPEHVPDGFFIVVNPPSGEEGLQQWLENAAIPPELRNGIRNGDIQLGSIGWNGVWTIPYRVRKGSNLPKHFHNWALFYKSQPAPNPLAELKSNSAKKTENSYVFKWNECPDQSRYCDNGALVKLTQHKDFVDLQVEVIGESLSQNSPWIHPTWTQAWNRPFVELTCGTSTRTFELASSIGFKREYMEYQPITTYFVANNSLLAPFTRHFRVPCSEPLRSLAVGRESSTVDRLRTSITLPAKKLTVKL
jgi:hypothetical protein